MKEENLMFKCVGDMEDIAAKMIYEKNKKTIHKVWKRIEEQIKNEPLKKYYKISIDKYSPKKMRAIKCFFCDYLRFGFSKSLPDDVMIDTIRYYVSSNASISLSATTTSSSQPNLVPISKFYITWFN